MLRKDERRYLLEENDYQYSLQDIPEPQLYRDMFSYDTVPKISFNHRSVPMYMPKNIWITDTTFRDGQQSRTPFTVKQVVDLYKLEHRLGGPNGLVRQSEFFVYTLCRVCRMVFLYGFSNAARYSDICRQKLPAIPSRQPPASSQKCAPVKAQHKEYIIVSNINQVFFSTFLQGMICMIIPCYMALPMSFINAYTAVTFMPVTLAANYTPAR